MYCQIRRLGGCCIDQLSWHLLSECGQEPFLLRKLQTQTEMEVWTEKNVRTIESPAAGKYDDKQCDGRRFYHE